MDDTTAKNFSFDGNGRNDLDESDEDDGDVADYGVVPAEEGSDFDGTTPSTSHRKLAVRFGAETPLDYIPRPQGSHDNEEDDAAALIEEEEEFGLVGTTPSTAHRNAGGFNRFGTASLPSSPTSGGVNIAVNELNGSGASYDTGTPLGGVESGLGDGLVGTTPSTSHRYPSMPNGIRFGAETPLGPAGLSAEGLRGNDEANARDILVDDDADDSPKEESEKEFGLVGTTPNTSHRKAGIRFESGAETPLVVGGPVSEQLAFAVGMEQEDDDSAMLASPPPGGGMEGLSGPLQATPLRTSRPSPGYAPLSTGRSSGGHRQRMGTAPGEPSPFDSGGDDDDDEDEDEQYEDERNDSDGVDRDDDDGGDFDDDDFDGSLDDREEGDKGERFSEDDDGVVPTSGRDTRKDKGATSFGDKSAKASAKEDDVDVDDDDELTDEQRLLAEELGMFSLWNQDPNAGMSPSSGRSFGEEASRAVDLHYKAQQAREAKSAGNALDQLELADGGGDGDSNVVIPKKVFAVRSWSGRRKFEASWDETTGEFIDGMPEAIPQPLLAGSANPTSGSSEFPQGGWAGDRWTSPVPPPSMVLAAQEGNSDSKRTLHFEGSQQLQQQQPTTSPMTSPRKPRLPLGDVSTMNNSVAACAGKNKTTAPPPDGSGDLGWSNFNRSPNRRSEVSDEEEEEDEEDMEEEEEEEEEEGREGAEEYYDERGGAGGELEATNRQKELLFEMAEQKRRLREEAEAKAHRHAERKRRQTEMLLERARARRAGMLVEESDPSASSGGVEQQQDGGHKGKLGKKKKSGKHFPVEAALTADEMAAQMAAEEAEREANKLRAKARRKAAKQHLALMVAARKAEAEELALKEQAEMERKAAVKEKGLKLARARRAQCNGASNKAEGGASNDLGETAANHGEETPRGSGVSAVRAAKAAANSGGGSSSNGSGSKGAHAGAGAAGGAHAVPEAELTAEEKEEKKQRLRDMKAAKARHQDMLKAMAEEARKKQSEEDAMAARLAKRAALMRARILAEAAERKLQREQEVGASGPAVSTKGGGSGQDAETAAAAKVAAKQQHARAAAKRAARAAAEEAAKHEKGEGGNSSDDDDDDDGAKGAAKKKASSSEKRQAAAASSVGSRLHAARLKKAGGPNATNVGLVGARDFEDWKRKHGVPPEGKVFGLTGWYPCVKEALLSRGWFFNPDRESFFFDLKWTLKSKELKQEQLQPWQLTNHILKNTAITTKVGLLKSLRELSWLAPVNPDAIYPRSYDLNSNTDMQSFLDDYRCTAAQGMLKEVVAACRKEHWSNAGYATGKQFSAPFDANDFDVTVPVNMGALTVALTVCERAAYPLLDDDAYLDGGSKVQLLEPCTEVEWEVLGYASRQAYAAEVQKQRLPPTSSSSIGSNGKDQEDDDVDVDNDAELTEAGKKSKRKRLAAAAAAGPSLPRPVFCAWDKGAVLVAGSIPRPVDGFLRHTERDVQLKQQKQSGDSKPVSERELQRAAEAKEMERSKLREACCNPTTSVAAVGSSILARCVAVLATLDEQSPQCALNGRFETKNLWIVKPSAKSRGRGIQTFRDLDKLLEYVGVTDTAQSSTLWVVQKYMENPLLVAKRKFDIRQWVLVTDWNPLTIYFYNDCYARFAAAPYEDNDAALENEHVHLVNNSVAKNSEDFHASVTAENGEPIQDCMWTKDQIAAYMKYQAKERGLFKGHDARLKEVRARAARAHQSGKQREHDAQGGAFGGAQEDDATLPAVDESQGEDVFATRCYAKMRDIAKCALMTAQGQVEHRKCSWELYGYDYMFDDDFKPWLIEINSSPACDYSTLVTEAFVPRALEDVIKVVVDLREWESKGGDGRQGKKAKEAAGARPDTGGWEPIYKGQYLETQKTALGTDLAVVGAPVLKRRPGGQSFTLQGRKVNDAEYAQPVPAPTDQGSDEEPDFCSTATTTAQPMSHPSQRQHQQQSQSKLPQPSGSKDETSGKSKNTGSTSSSSSSSKGNSKKGPAKTSDPSKSRDGDDDDEDDDDEDDTDEDEDGAALKNDDAVDTSTKKESPAPPAVIKPRPTSTGKPRFTMKHLAAASAQQAPVAPLEGESREAEARSSENQGPSGPSPIADAIPPAVKTPSDNSPAPDEAGSIDFDDI